MSFAKSFYNWLNKGSAQKAADPAPKPACHVPDNSNFQGQVIPFEFNTQEDIIIGSGINLGKKNIRLQGPNGDFYFHHKSFSVLCGCGHLVSQLQPESEHGKTPKRGISGKCLYCETQYQEMVLQGQMEIIEAERKSLICSECARMTVSGILCCPRHCVRVADENGQVVYWDPEEQERQRRKEIISKIFSPFVFLLTEQSNPQLPSPEDNDE